MAISTPYVTFANELFADLINDHNGSIAISPLFIQSSLALLLVGADGKTLNLMKESLKLTGMSRTAIANQFQSLIQPYANSSANASLQLATGVFINHEYSSFLGFLNSSFLNVASQQFNALVQPMSFDSKEKAAGIINEWVDSATNNTIEQIIKPAAINPKTTLLLANAVHFHGLWQHEFALETIQPMEFYTNGYCIRSNAKTIASVFDTVIYVIYNWNDAI